MRRTAPVLALVVIALLALATMGGRAQEATILPALLAEVKGLRAAMEQMASAGPRVQLALGRLQLQEQRLNTMAARLQTVRDRLVAAQRQAGEQQAELERLEVAARNTTDKDASAIEQMLPGLKRELAQSVTEVQRLQVEEAAIGADIGTEQARWSDFNQRLEELERSLIRR